MFYCALSIFICTQPQLARTSFASFLNVKIILGVRKIWTHSEMLGFADCVPVCSSEKPDPCALFSGKPVMIVTEYMENGSLDSFLRVSATGN